MLIDKTAMQKSMYLGLIIYMYHAFVMVICQRNANKTEAERFLLHSDNELFFKCFPLHFSTSIRPIPTSLVRLSWCVLMRQLPFLSHWLRVCLGPIQCSCPPPLMGEPDYHIILTYNNNLFLRCEHRRFKIICFK